jgi:hypothetical protein
VPGQAASGAERAAERREQRTEHGAGGDQVLEAVAAQQSAGREQGAVVRLGLLGEQVERERRPEPAAAEAPGAGSGKQQQRDEQHGQELDDVVEAQVAGALKLGGVPVENGRRSDQEERSERVSAETVRESVAHDQAEERHKSHRHRQAVPDQRRVRRGQVVPRRTESDQRHSASEDRHRLRNAGRHQAAQPREAEQADEKEQQIRHHVPEVGHSGPGAIIGEQVVRRILPEPPLAECESEAPGEGCEEKDQAPGLCRRLHRPEAES